MVAAPRTSYAKAAGGGYLAYQALGVGAVDVLVFGGGFFPVDLMWDEPRLVHFLNRLSSFSRHAWFDPRGNGASDRVPHGEGRLYESSVDDAMAVLDDIGCERAAVLSLGTPTGLVFAATHPERTTALVLVNVSARMRSAADYPQGASEERIAQRIDALLQLDQSGTVAELAPSTMDDLRFRDWLERAVRLAAPPEDRLWRVRSLYDLDVREVLDSIRTPTLVINRRDRPTADQTRFVAEHIASAKYVEVPGADTFAFTGEVEPILDAIEEFLTGHLPAPSTDRVLATVLFTDLVNSTRLATEMGDRRWRELLTTHDALIRAEIDRFRGERIKSTGDGVLAIFDGPARAIRCACAIRDTVQSLGVKVRAGLHAGEIERQGDDIAGIAVHIGERVASRAGPGEVFISRTVADLIAGSDIELRDQGEHELKGVPGTWRLLSVSGG